MRARPKQTCRDCHFLAEYDVNAHGAKPRGSWPLHGRSQVPNPVTPWLVPGCYMQVWKLRGHTLGESLSSDIAREDLSGCLDQDRRGDCFYFKAKEVGMSLEAAETLERRQSEQKHLKTTRRISFWALGTSMVALVVRLLWP